MSTIMTAAMEYMSRPKDEAYPNYESMIAAAALDRDNSRKRSYNLRDLSVQSLAQYRAEHPSDPFVVSQDKAHDLESLVLASPKGIATMSHWSFSQLARQISAPAGYLRSLSSPIAAAALNYGMSRQPAGQTASLLVRTSPDGSRIPHVRSITSDSYGRVWDADLHQATFERLFAHRSSGTGGEWIAPPTWSGESAGTWRGDQTSFVVRVDGGSIVSDPSLANWGGAGRGSDGRMFRGVMIRNSEVGAASLSIETVLFQFICGNLMLWGAAIDRRFVRRHVGDHALRDTLRELGTIAREWTNRPASQDEAMIAGLMRHELASTPAAVVDELVKSGYTREQAVTACATCEQHFAASPRSYWGIAQGTTQLAQDSAYQDARHELDKLAAVVMRRGLARVAA